ncbi:MAG TPA: hypothetical protein VFE78_32175 [Gemmataceae bacterium]|jgi:hypothetical protein|nr:hypothetical protein [Gemmataceae bacterium]
MSLTHSARWLLLAVAAGLSAAPARAGLLGPYLPDDSEVVVTVNVRQLLDSPLVKKHALEKAREALKDLDQVESILKDLGFDPFKDLERITVASPGGTEKDRGLVILHGTFDLDKFKSKGDEAARDYPDYLKIHKVPVGAGATQVVYEVTPPDADMPLFVALPAKDTLLVSPGKDYVVDALKKAARKVKPALKNKDVQALLEKMDEKQSVAVALLGSALTKGGGAPAPVKGLLEKVEAVGGGVTVGDDVKVEVVLAAKTAEGAKELHEGLDKGLKQALALLSVLASGQKELNPALEVVKTLRVSAKGKVVTLKGRVSPDVLEDALKKDE